MANDQVRNNEAEHRFELDVNGMMAVANYRLDGDTISLTHTEVPGELRGNGLGEKLARGALDLIRRDGHRVQAQCPFIAHFIKKNPEYQDLLSGH
jgi:uncharacterized protein